MLSDMKHALVALALSASLLSAEPPTPKPRAETPSTQNPFAAHALPREQRRWLAGSVRERRDAGPYAYLLLEDSTGAAAWVVSLAVTTPRSPRVRALLLGRAEHFYSRRLRRVFSPLLFAAVR